MKSSLLLLSLEFFISFNLIWSIDIEHETTTEMDSEFCPKIIGGQTAIQGMFPWMVAIYKQGNFICSGFIVSPTTIVSAAHCFIRDGIPENRDQFHGFAGNVKRSDNGTLLHFESIKIHPEYNSENLLDRHSDEMTIENDIALLKTQIPILFNEYIRPVCIFKTEATPFSHATAIGWGITSVGGNSSPSDVLKYVRLSILPTKFCRPIIITGDKSKICAVKLKGGLCYGDSGY